MKAKTPTCRIVLCPRDLEVLLSLWRWKLATTATIAREHFDRSDSDYAYRRLRLLALNDFVALRSVDELSGHAWILRPKGFDAIRHRLPVLRQTGFRSEAPYHDLLCAALQRGDSFFCNRKDVQHVTEQELRSVAVEALPAWVPVSELHRPDGYSNVRLSGQPSIIAFEVENHLKKESDYCAPIAFYGARESIFRVVWILADTTDIVRFEKLLRRLDPKNADIHLLLTRIDLMNKLWDAPILRGIERGRTLAHLLRRDVSLDLSLAGLVRDTFPVLNFQKRPFISSFYERRLRNAIANRIDVPHLFDTSLANRSQPPSLAPLIPRSLQSEPSKGDHEE